MRKHWLYLLALLAAGALGTSHAQALANTATITWVAPTANDDGSTPPLIGGYNVYVNSTDTALSAMPGTLNGGTWVNAPVTSLTVPNIVSVGNVLTWTTPVLPVGNYFFAVSTWWCPASGTGCLESALSAHVNITIAAKVAHPTQPTAVAVRVN